MKTLVATIFSTLLLPLSQSIAGVNCGKTLTYEQLQEVYMREHHIPDYRNSTAIWDRTLYIPLQEYVGQLMDLKPSNNMVFAYVGVGPLAPLFGHEPQNSPLLKRIAKIVLMDVSDTSLAQSKQRLLQANPVLEIETIKLDITLGAGESFAKWILKIVKESNSPKQVLEALMETNYSLPKGASAALSSIPGVSADIVYSEMVATFTGTAAMITFEKLLKDKFSSSPDFNSYYRKIMEVAQQKWQRYNDETYATQILVMQRLGTADGIVAVATDTLKVFDDKTIPAISSFSSNGFPELQLKNLEKLPYVSSGTVAWDDSHHEPEKISKVVEALAPHRHQIGFDTYRIKK